MRRESTVTACAMAKKLCKNRSPTVLLCWGVKWSGREALETEGKFFHSQVQTLTPWPLEREALGKVSLTYPESAILVRPAVISGSSRAESAGEGVTFRNWGTGGMWTSLGDGRSTPHPPL